MSGYRELMRRKLLEQFYDKMSEEEKRTFVMLTMQDKSRDEIMQALSAQNAKIDDVSRKIGKYPFASDLLANISGNFLTDGLIWIGHKLLRKL